MCSSTSEGRYGVWVWGIAKKGQQIREFIPCATDRIARHAAAAALLELGARAHFCICTDEDHARAMWLLTETDQ